MSCEKIHIFLLLCTLHIFKAYSSCLKERIHFLCTAYPDYIMYADEKAITWTDGTIMKIEDYVPSKTEIDSINNATLFVKCTETLRYHAL